MPFVQNQPPFTAHLSIRPKAGSPARCFLTLSYRLCVSQLCKHRSLDLRHRQCKTRHFHFTLPLRVLYLPHGFARTARSEFAVCGCRLDMNPAGRVPLKPHQTTMGMRGLEPVGRFLHQVRMREVNLWLHATAADRSSAPLSCGQSRPTLRHSVASRFKNHCANLDAGFELFLRSHVPWLPCLSY